MTDLLDWDPPALGPPEVEQLRALGRAGLTDPGDLISKRAEKSLRDKGLSARLEGWVVVTREGRAWLRRALDEREAR